MQRIKSFCVNHDVLDPGIYIARIDGDVTTYDLRTRKPNAHEYMDNLTIHSVEHMLATFLRNSEIANDILYFGPVGCRTGFSLLVRNAVNDKVLAVLIDCLKKVENYEGVVFGASSRECGNYRELSLQAAQCECARYRKILESIKNPTFLYKE